MHSSTSYEPLAISNCANKDWESRKEASIEIPRFNWREKLRIRSKNDRKQQFKGNRISPTISKIKNYVNISESYQYSGNQGYDPRTNKATYKGRPIEQLALGY